MKVYEWAECLLVPRLDRVVAVSESLNQKALFGSRLGRSLKVIHNGISTTDSEDTAIVPNSDKARNTLRDFLEWRTCVCNGWPSEPRKGCCYGIAGIFRNFLKSTMQQGLLCLARVRKRIRS